MPSRRHDLLAYAVPRLRKARDLDTEERERARVMRWHAGLDRTFPTRLVRRFDRRFTLREEDAGGFPSYVMEPRGVAVRRTVVYVHGGGFMAPIDPFHVRYAARLARGLQARVVLPDYPLAPEHTWRDSFDAMTDLAARWSEPHNGGGAGTVLAGDSAGGGYALALALALRDRGGPQPAQLLLHAPWVDLTASTPETVHVADHDPWLFLGKMHAYAAWWAGSEEDLARPEVSPALGDLRGLPPALMFCGTRDLLVPGCRLLADRAAAAGWDLRYLEAPDLIHVFPLLPFIPEARRAWRHTLEFLR
ncbi:alpha/beta hydrolase [Nocardioides sp. GCM10027113]|uniref:alpha/beta hydrolase n=1 Tax=unclassified Nocardioides TaxID=2615069 RepID=UPI00361442AB